MLHDDPVHMMLAIVQVLDDADISYFVTGGMAVVVWGKPRFTADVDLVVELTSAALPRLQRSLERFCENGMIDSAMMQEALERKGEFNYIDADSDVKVDFWVSGNTAFDKKCFERRVRREVLGHSLWFISPEDLLLMKLRWMKGGSHRSIDDARSIMAGQQSTLDWKYIESLAQRLGVEEELRRAKVFADI